MKSLSLKVGIVFLGIWLFVFVIGHLETYGVDLPPFCENPYVFCYRNQDTIPYASKNIVRAGVESVYKGQPTIEMGARVGYRKWYSTCEQIPSILCIFIAIWGTAIILVAGAILYFIVIEPIIKQKHLPGEKDRQTPLSQNRQGWEENAKLNRVVKRGGTNCWGRGFQRSILSRRFRLSFSRDFAFTLAFSLYLEGISGSRMSPGIAK